MVLVTRHKCGYSRPDTLSEDPRSPWGPKEDPRADPNEDHGARFSYPTSVCG